MKKHKKLTIRYHYINNEASKQRLEEAYDRLFDFAFKNMEERKKEKIATNKLLDK